MSGTSLFLIYFVGIMEHGAWNMEHGTLKWNMELVALENEEKMDQSCHGRQHEDITRVVAYHHRKGLRMKHGSCHTDTGHVCTFSSYI